MKKIILFSVLFMMAILQNAGAVSLTITSFTCNGKTSLAIENGANINCDVRIQNNDGSNAASVSTITLLVSDGWAESSTYSVALNTNIAAGHSTDSTFEGIKPVTTVNNLKFTSVEIDGTPHTEEVTSVSVNAMAIKTLSSSASVSSTGTGNEFDVYSSVMVGGNFNSMTLTLALSGCSLKTGESAAKNMGSMTHNAQESTSWKVVQGSGSTCSLSVTSSGTTDTVTLTRFSSSVSVTNPNPSSSSSSTSGGGGGGGSNATNATNATVTASEETAATAAEAAPAAEEKKAEGPATSLGALFGYIGTNYTLYLVVLAIIIVIAIVVVKKRR